MSEEVTAGGKEFFFTLIWAAGLYILCGAVMSLFGDYAFIGGIIGIIVFCVFGFFILTRYTAKFTYTLKNGRLRINRMIGKRNKEIELDCSDITYLSFADAPKPFAKHPYHMHKSIISRRNSLYIRYNGKNGETMGIIIEPSYKLRKKIEKESKWQG